MDCEGCPFYDEYLLQCSLSQCEYEEDFEGDYINRHHRRKVVFDGDEEYEEEIRE